jgi:hypothetical protein
MPLYRVQYRTAAYIVGDVPYPAGSWTTYVDPAPTDKQTDDFGTVDTGSLLGGSVSVGGLTDGVRYEFIVDRLDAQGQVLQSSQVAEEIPGAPDEQLVGDPTTVGTGNTVSAQLATRNGQRGLYITFSNASWTSFRAYFRPRDVTSFPGDSGSPNLTVTRQPFSVVAANVTGSGDPTTQCLKVTNTQMFVPFDFGAYDILVRANYRSNDLVVIVESPPLP